MNAASVARLQEINPFVASKAQQMSDMLGLDPQPITLVISRGLASWADQDALYAIGRTVPGHPCTHDGIVRPIGTCAEHPMGLTVTNAKGGESWHNLGCAFDAEPEIIDGVIDWNASHPQWQRMIAVGESLGLTSGSTWVHLVDTPHWQYTGRFPEDAPDDEARQIWQDQGAAAFWREVNSQ